MRHLSQCLESVRWADEVLVFHAGGEEPKTGPTVLPSLKIRNVATSGEARKLAAEIKTDWILYLWGEERVEAELQDELRALCRDASAQSLRAYRIPIRSYLLGRWVEGSLSGPSPSARLFRGVEELSMDGWEGSRLKGKPAAAPARGWIGDYGSSELSHAVDHLQSLSDFRTENLRAMASPPSPLRTVLCSVGVFMQMIFLNRLFSRGLAGLTLSALAAYGVLLSGAKVWEMRNVRRGESGNDKIAK